MNATSPRLLAVAYGYGGGLIKFGGDALLLLFDGARPPGRGRPRRRRDARRARGDRRARRPPAGTVELRMHVGIHSGHFLFFLVGDSHRELIVAGPARPGPSWMEATPRPARSSSARRRPRRCRPTASASRKEREPAGLVRRPSRVLEPHGPARADLARGCDPAPLGHSLGSGASRASTGTSRSRSSASGLDDLLTRAARRRRRGLDEVVRSIQRAADDARGHLPRERHRRTADGSCSSRARRNGGDDEAGLRTLRAGLTRPAASRCTSERAAGTSSPARSERSSAARTRSSAHAPPSPRG